VDKVFHQESKNGTFWKEAVCKSTPKSTESFIKFTNNFNTNLMGLPFTKSTFLPCFCFKLFWIPAAVHKNMGFHLNEVKNKTLLTKYDI